MNDLQVAIAAVDNLLRYEHVGVAELKSIRARLASRLRNARGLRDLECR